MWLLIAIACSDAPPPAPADPPLVVASGTTTFETVARLGPHRSEAVITRTLRRPAGEPRRTEEMLTIQWKDVDNWRMVDAKDRAARTEILVADGVAWVDLGGRGLVRKGDAEPWRVQLTQTYDAWALALESLAHNVRIVPEGLEDVEGRRVWRSRLDLVPNPENAHRTWTPQAVAGNVWIDEATALKLVGDVRVSATSGGETLEVALKFATAGIGMDPRLPAPPSAPPSAPPAGAP